MTNSQIYETIVTEKRGKEILQILCTLTNQKLTWTSCKDQSIFRTILSLYFRVKKSVFACPNICWINENENEKGW